MEKPTIAVVSFPGTNGDTENLRTLRRCGFEAFVFMWNEDRAKLTDVDGYFFGAGFSYEDRGRSGMIAARDPLMQFMVEEAARGKAVIGNCNGAQILVESGLIPLDKSLRMSLARNVIQTGETYAAPGFLNEWVWITPSCKRDRCATSDWEGAMHIPIAHGEGRFTTKDKDLFQELEKSGQLAFRYCDGKGNISTDPEVTPNGSSYAMAGICNPAGNVVALMPHPERTTNGDPYFHSLRSWIQNHSWKKGTVTVQRAQDAVMEIPGKEPGQIEILIDTIIVNNEERSVEQALRREIPKVCLKQMRYVRLQEDRVKELLTHISFFNPHKEIAYVRRHGMLKKWNNDRKAEEESSVSPLNGIALFRRDEPDTAAAAFGSGTETGICYVCRDVEQKDLERARVLEIFRNPHASALSQLR